VPGNKPKIKFINKPKNKLKNLYSIMIAIFKRKGLNLKISKALIFINRKFTRTFKLLKILASIIKNLINGEL
jgi:hypothetical protein